jgi:hypothetical protein
MKVFCNHNPILHTEPNTSVTMKMKSSANKAELARLSAANASLCPTLQPILGFRHLGRFSRAALLLLAAASSAVAQTTNVTDLYNVTSTTVAATVNSVTLTDQTVNKVRFTVAVNETSSSATSLRVSLGGGQATLVNSVTNFIDPNYYVTNFYDLNPAVATLAATGVPATGGGAGVVFGAQSLTNTGAGNATFDVSVTLNYTNLASGDYDMAIEAASANTWRYPLPVKAGYKWSAGGGANTNFNAAVNWVGGVVPGANDIVILDVAGAVASATQPTIAIANNTTIGSVSDIHTGDNYTHWNIAAGATLSILGDGGFRQLVDQLEVNDRSRIRASGAGTMIVSNANAEFNLFTTRQNTSYDNADFSALNTLIIDVKKIAFNDIAAYPNIGTNGVLNRPRRNVYDMDWALTNILRATHTDANGWANEAREYGLTINRENVGGQTGNDGGMHFGLHNELYFDSILFGGYSQMESPEVDFRAASGSYLLLRNTDKISRVSNLTIADPVDYFATGTANGGGTKVDVSFTKGTVDALIDTLIVGRDPRITANGPGTGKLFLGAGTFDVNNAFLGYQTANVGGTESGAGQGRLELSLGGTFRVNDTLVLGYTATNLTTVLDTFGQLAISGAGSTAEINTLTVGGPANVSVNNTISVTAGGTLVISNTAGDVSARIQTLTMSDSTLTLFPDGGISTPYVYVNNLVNGGAGNTIKLAAVTGVSVYPATLALISYTGSAAPNFTLELPPGLYGVVLNNTANSTIDAVITTTPPASRIWNGNVNGSWDQLTANWQGGTVFNNGDTVTFDDTAAGTTTINVVGTVIPGSGGMLVTNDNKAYSFSGGDIAGAATITKEGNNTLTIDAMSQMALALNGGTVTGSGTLGTTTVGAAGTLNYAGTVNSLTTAGTSSSAGTVNVKLTVSGGTFDNSGTVNGTYSLSGGTSVNQPGSTVNTIGVSTLAAGATLVHNGVINLGNANVNSRLTIAGNLTGSGEIYDTTGDVNGNNGRLEINPNGVFTPGGSNTIGTFSVGARFDLNTGNPDGLMIIDIDLNHANTNDVLVADKWSNFRGALTLNNIGAVPFAVGQSFKIFRQSFDLANTPENAFDLANKITPKVPGVGLQWDVSNLKTNGIIAVIAAPLTSPSLTNTVVGGTNLTINWPTTHLGYQLQAQTNTLDVGISNNWFPIAGSENTTSWSVPLDSVNPAVFYRLSNQ